MAIFCVVIDRGGSRAAATSKMECLKHSILDVAAALNLPLMGAGRRWRTFWLPSAGR